MSDAFVLCCEAAKTSAAGSAERHGPDKEHVQSAASGQKVCKYMYVNTKCDVVCTNLGEGDEPIRICLVPGTPATSLSCECSNVIGTFL